MKWRIHVAIALMWPGVPVSDWATILPRVSKTPQARSCDSRTTVEKAVRMSAACCSLVTDSSRLHRTSSAIGSIVVFDVEVAEVIDVDPCVGADDGRGFALFDDRRPAQLNARVQQIAIVNRCW